MIHIPDQPLATKVLAGAFAHGRVPQQFLFTGPPGTGKREAAVAVAHHLIGMPDEEAHRASVDLSIVRASGQEIRIEDLDDALRDLASKPSVGKARVVIVEQAERFSETTGNRVLKPLEEPPPHSFLILISDRPEDLLPTIRSRCIPVPFRNPGWRVISQRLIERGVDPVQAAALARSDGPMAIAGDDFYRSMREVGSVMGLSVLAGGKSGRQLVDDAQSRMEIAAAQHPSQELLDLRATAAELEGKRGGKTAAKKAEDQEKRERRRMISDGWDAVISGAAGIVADALAVSHGAETSIRNRHFLDQLRTINAQPEFCERAIEELELTRAELQLNPTVDVAVQSALIRIEHARQGERHALTHPGRLPW